VKYQSWAKAQILEECERLRSRLAVLEQKDSEDRQEKEGFGLLSRIFEHAPEGIMVTDTLGRIITVNQAFTFVTGYNLEEVKGKNPNILKSGRHDVGFYKPMWKSLIKTGRWHGEIWNRKKDGEIYLEWQTIQALKNERGKVTHYVAFFTDITSRREAEQRLIHRATHDALTDLPNRFLFEDRMSQALIRTRRNRKPLALLYLDLNGFKMINDTFGHTTGDLLLQAVSGRLGSCIRKSDTLARIGGDEFTILVENFSYVQDVVHITQKILGALSQPYDLGKIRTFMSASIGISICPEDGEDVSTLMERADTAMYRAKERGENFCQFSMETLISGRRKDKPLEKQLHHALEREELVLHYQPQVDLRNGRIIGLEALLRWNHPDLGMVSPTEFIPLAEETGLIVPIGEWVIRTASEQCRAWLASNLPPVRVSVNLSALELRDSLPDMVNQVLNETGLNPAHLGLELVESICMHRAEITVETLHRLKDLGVHLSIDDFGTGCSSLSFLKNFSIDSLKIDRLFLQNIAVGQDAMAIVTALITMGHSLGLEVIAEGVETEEQMTLLRDRGCDQMQGFYFSHPVPAENIPALLQKNQRLISACH
jgi:diguanylate cyclase (GGDEF)-like protein/PAS domain S-box-containing protein